MPTSRPCACRAAWRKGNGSQPSIFTIPNAGFPAPSSAGPRGSSFPPTGRPTVISSSRASGRTKIGASGGSIPGVIPATAPTRTGILRPCPSTTATSNTTPTCLRPGIILSPASGHWRRLPTWNTITWTPTCPILPIRTGSAAGSPLGTCLHSSICVSAPTWPGRARPTGSPPGPAASPARTISGISSPRPWWRTPISAPLPSTPLCGAYAGCPRSTTCITPLWAMPPWNRNGPCCRIWASNGIASRSGTYGWKHRSGSSTTRSATKS